jgi:hypothetical protein
MIAYPRVLVTGGRDVTDRYLVEFGLDGIRNLVGDFILVHGAARGVASMAAVWARKRWLPRPERHSDGLREMNPREVAVVHQAMVDAGAVLCLGFPGGPGTADCLARARKAGIPVVRVERRSGQPVARLESMGGENSAMWRTL